MPVYKLEREPFPEERSEPFYLSTRALAARLEEVRVALARGHVLLVDEAGSGRSTLAERLTRDAPEAWRCFRVDARPTADEKVFVRELLEGLGLPPREPAAAALRDADTLLELLADRATTPVIVVDDADRLDEGGLRQLAYLARRWDDFGARFLVLTGPGRAARALAGGGEEGLPGVPAVFDMPRLDEGQVGDYLHMSLFRAGLAGDSPFDAALVARVTRESDGRVGAIGPIARRLLPTTGGDGAAKRRRAGRRWPLAVAALAGVGVLLAMAIPGTPSSLGTAGVRQGPEVFRSSIRPAQQEPGRRDPRASASADTAPP